MSLESTVSVIRKEKGQKKKRRRKSQDGSDVSGKSDENLRVNFCLFTKILSLKRWP